MNEANPNLISPNLISNRPLQLAVVKDGELLPQFCAPYTMRIGNLCQGLAKRGHGVTWYQSTFRHNEKTFYAPKETVEEMPQGYRMHFLPAGSYRRHISFARWFHHCRLAVMLFRRLLEGPKLDAVVCCIPILEVAAACFFYCRLKKVPLILDILDPWPRIFVDYAPKALRPLVRALLTPYFALARRLFAGVEVLVACSQGFLSWAYGLSGRTPEKRLADRVIYLGAHRELDLLPLDPLLKTGGLRSIFMGGFGGPYDFEPICQMLEEQAKAGSDHHMFFLGQSGKRYQRLRSRLEKLPNVSFTGWLPRQRAYQIAKTCHLGWLPLGIDTDDYMPNKVFEYPALGLPFATRKGGESGEMVAEYGLGLCYKGDSGQELVERLAELKPGCHQLNRWKENAQKFYQSIASAEICTNQYCDLIEEVVRSKAMKKAHFEKS